MIVRKSKVLFKNKIKKILKEAYYFKYMIT